MAKIFIDAGHGGHDGGATANGLKEKDLTLKIAKKIQAKLKGKATIKMSRTTDKYLSLTERTNLANQWGADYFLSVHINAGGGNGKGFESYVYNGGVSAKTKSIRNTIHDEVMNSIGGKDRGKKTANFAVVRQSKMPAVLTENLFIDHKGDAAKLKDDAFLDKLAQGHVNGLIKAFNLKGGTSKPSTSKPSKPKPKPNKPNNATSKWTKVTGDWTGQTLGEGEYGKPVKQLQTKLANNNPPFYPNKSAKNNGVDTYYGSDTKDAVERFQSYYGLTVDGLAGKEVYGKLVGKSTSKPKKSKKKYPLPSGTLRKGSKGNGVKQVQRALNAANFKVGKVDGDYGRKTKDGVRRFQMVHDAGSDGKHIDGVYGPRTKTRLDKVVN